MQFRFITIITLLLACNNNSNQTIAKKKSNDSTYASQVDSISPRKSSLEFDRRYVSRGTSLPLSVLRVISQGHEAFDTACGEINGDDFPDLILVTSVINEDSVRTDGLIHDKRLRFDSIPLKRQLLIFTGSADGSYKLKCQNLNAVPCLDCCGMTDPYGGIAIQNQHILITRYCASNCKGISQFRFKYTSSKDNWFLESIIEESYCFDYRQYSLDTITSKKLNRIPITKFDVNKDE